MTTTSYSDQIIQALAKHGRLNTRQLAAKISCDTKKATQLVSFMRTSKKLQTDGEIDGLAAYSLTELGRTLVPTERHAAPPSPSTPSSLDDLAAAQLRPVRHEAVAPAPHRAPSPTNSDELKLKSNQPAPAFGLLNTGEFLIMADGQTIKIPAELVPTMRAQLNNHNGAFQ